MVNPEKILNPMPMPARKKGDVSLESILPSELMPEEGLCRLYLKTILWCRQDPTWRQTGELSDDQKKLLGEIIAKDPKIPERLAKQLRLIQDATQIEGVSEGKPVISSVACVLHGEVRRGETNEGY